VLNYSFMLLHKIENWQIQKIMKKILISYFRVCLRHKVHILLEHKGTEILTHNASHGRSWLLHVIDTEEETTTNTDTSRH